MHPTSSLRPARQLCPRSLLASSVLLCIFLLFGGRVTGAAETPAKKEPDVTESRRQFRAYLPTIRCKALLENERQSVADLERILGLYKLYVEGGLVSASQRGRVEEELLRGRIRVLQRDTAYRDSEDQFTHRFRVPAERRQKMENTAILPLAELLRRFERFAGDEEEVWYAALRLAPTQDVKDVRLALVKLLTTSALVEGTTLPKRFRKEWAEWEKIESIEETQKKLLEIRKERLDLRRPGDGSKIPIKKLPLPPDGDGDKDAGQEERIEKRKDAPRKDRPSPEDLTFADDLGSLAYHLRRYEEQPWKTMKDKLESLSTRNEEFNRILISFMAITANAYRERFGSLCSSWPDLPSTQLKEVNLLTCDDNKAEQTVARMLKTPEEQLIGKKKVRQLRTLTKSYRREQELFALVFLRREQIINAQQMPKAPEVVRTGLVGPVASRPTFDLAAFEAAPLLDALRSLSQAKRQLLQTWIDYQMVRLDLYGDLGLSLDHR